jgi:hypothetical protein
MRKGQVCLMLQSRALSTRGLGERAVYQSDGARLERTSGKADPCFNTDKFLKILVRFYQRFLKDNP